jgi:2'-5' RNA ligase
MRLFAAIPMPDPAREALLDLLAKLERTGWPVRWVGEDNLHLTVKFYGEVPEEDVTRLGDGLAAAVRGTPVLQTQLNGVNAFPALRHPRVIWAAVDAPPALELMQHRVEQAAAEVGFPVSSPVPACRIRHRICWSSWCWTLRLRHRAWC